MVSDLSVKKVSFEELRLGRMPRILRTAFLALAKERFLTKDGWYLAGGTALALQIGHRQSRDLDFFNPQKSFEIIKLERQLLKTERWITSFRDVNTLYGKFLGAKTSFIAYPFFVPSKQRFRCQNLEMLLPEDIAAMKIIAISQRGRKRDFVDLYWYVLNEKPLFEIIRRATKQYPGQENNVSHILGSLVYFNDAEEDPMPKVFFKASWQQIKKYFRREVPRIARQLLGLNRK